MKSPEEVQAALREVLEHHARYPTLKALVDALRDANNFMSQTELAATMNVSQASFTTSMRLTPYRAAEKICSVNPFGFSENDGSAALARQILLRKTPEKRLWSQRLIDVSRKAVTEEVVGKVARYQEGTLSESDLPLFKDVLRGIFPIKQFNHHDITQAMLDAEKACIANGETPLLSEKDRKNLSKRVTGFFSITKPRPEEYALLLMSAEVPEEAIFAFQQLPAGQLKKQTAFTQALQEIQQQYVERNNDGSINQSALARYTKFVDPNQEGISDKAVNKLLLGKTLPTQHSVRLLAQALTHKITGKQATSVHDIPQTVKNFIESVGFVSEKLFQTAHEVIAAATLTTPIFELWREIRLASDINQPCLEFIKNTAAEPETYRHWERSITFPDGNSILPLCEQLIVRTESFLPKQTDGQPDHFSDAEKEKIRAIARYNLQQRQAKRDTAHKENAQIATRMYAVRHNEGRSY